MYLLIESAHLNEVLPLVPLAEVGVVHLRLLHLSLQLLIPQQHSPCIFIHPGAFHLFIPHPLVHLALPPSQPRDLLFETFHLHI